MRDRRVGWSREKPAGLLPPLLLLTVAVVGLLTQTALSPPSIPLHPSSPALGRRELPDDA